MYPTGVSPVGKRDPPELPNRREKPVPCCLHILGVARQRSLQRLLFHSSSSDQNSQQYRDRDQASVALQPQRETSEKQEHSQVERMAHDTVKPGIDEGLAPLCLVLDDRYRECVLLDRNEAYGESDQ